MSDDQHESIECDETMEEDSMLAEGHEDGEEDVGEDEEEVETEESQGVPTTSEKKKPPPKKKKGGKKSSKKKNNCDYPDPYKSTSAEISAAIGLTDVDVDYEQEEFQSITNLKNFSSLVKPYILKVNPGTNVTKMYPLFQVKYKEFQDHMTAHGKSIQKQQRAKFVPVPVPVTPQEKIIPQKTRSSARRKRRDGSDGEGGGHDSDQEFEALIKQHEKQQDEAEKGKEEARINRAAAKVDKRKAALESARASKRARKEQGVVEENHQENCEVCNQDGELMLCDTCTRAYHVACIDENMEQPPEGDWSCPHCEEHGPDVLIVEEEPAKANMDYCRICKETSNILLCDTCPSSYHAYCIDPPLTEIPEGEWSCPRCIIPEPAQRIEKILSWRWKEISYPEPLECKEGEEASKDDVFLKPPRKMEPRREREFFVKWKYLAYWQCEWLSETLMDVYFTALVRMYWRKVDSENPPIFEESTLSRHHSDHDPYKLRERFYQYGVKPEWMQIHRIINHLSYAKSQQDYLVKWKELSYEHATWERDDTDIANYEDAIIKYWHHRERMLNDEVPRNVQKMIAKQREAKGLGPKEDEVTSRRKKREKIDILKKYEVQPDFISETGGNLHPYQLEGINWLRHCWSNGTDAILADEMGLGKTVQSLTFLYTLMKEGHTKGPFLIAAPLSTIINWEREAELWCPDFYVVTYVGDRESRMVIREHEFSFVDGAVRGGPKVSKIKTLENLKFHVLLTSYECINMDKAILSSIDWAALVVDEAHRLKNNQSTFFKNLREYNIQYRVLLTGTPLQNNLEELFHLLNFLAPDRFNQLESFTAEFSEISKEDQIEKLHNLLGPHMLRRLKADVLTGMPSKQELIVRVELSAMQKKYYKNILTRNFDALNVKNGGTQMSLINIIMELKKCCNHPYLFMKACLEAPKLKNGMYEGSALIKNAGKFVLLQKMLRKLKDGGHRVLIFSQMTMMLDILEDFCDVEGYKYERIDGSITGLRMFRKPKAKGAIRQRKSDGWDEPDAENQQVVSAIEVKQPAVPRPAMSFDADEGADSTFKLKKDKKKVEELKRQHKLEEEAEKLYKEEKIRKEALDKIVKKEKLSKEDKKTKNERHKYLDKYRDKSAKHISNSESYEYEENLDIDAEAISSVSNKFNSAFEGIPDSRAVFEAKKRRERARREGNQDGYIPLDDTQKLKSKSERNRLIREDENDDSDEECTNKFYSARELLRTEEDRRREEQEGFLERENGDIDEAERIKGDDDSENEEWEKQQIRKAVSRREIGQLRTEKRNTSKLFGHTVPVEDDTAMDMDIDLDMDVQVIGKPEFTGPSNTGGVVKIEDILAKLKLRIQERDEALNFRKEEKRKLEQNIEENKSMIAKIEMELPNQSTKYTMYQELRVYSRSLLECLNEKVGEINSIIDKKRDCGKSRTSRLSVRRRQDMRDQHAECMQGRNARMGEAAGRAAERDARRGRRRREREFTLARINHEEGLSTDDEEPTPQSMNDQKICDEVEAVASVLFADALDEYSDLRKVFGRMTDWLAVDPKSFQDAYVYLCIPKLSSPYVRLQILRADFLRKETILTSMQWFHIAMLAGSENAEIDQSHEILVELAPAIVEKVVIPFLIDTVKEEWDPMSLRQTRHLTTFCSLFEKLPNLTEKSKQFNAFLNAIRERICDCISEDLFMPIFMPNALEQPICRQFHDRQFWTCIKLIKSINALSPLISIAARFELVVEKCVNSQCVMALRTGSKNDVTAERKVRGLLAELDDSLLKMGGRTSFRQLIGTLELIAEEQSKAGRSFHKEIRKFLEKLER